MTVGDNRIEVMAGGLRWQILPEYCSVLLGPRGLRLDEWLASGQAQLIKSGLHRNTYRVELPGLSFYLKHFRLTNLQAWLRELVRPAKARSEYRRALAVAARGVPTIVPLAIGEPCPGAGPGESYLLTRSLDNMEPLNTFIDRLSHFPPPRLTRIRQRLAEELGRFLAYMHDAGIIHQDLHPGNLLVRLDCDDRPWIALIDLHAVRLRPPLGWSASRKNLIVLNRWFMLRADRSDRLRFWKSYCQARTRPGWWGNPDLIAPRIPHPHLTNDLARDLERATWESNLSFWKGRDRRCLCRNRYHRPVRAAGVSGYAVNDLEPDVLAWLLADLDAPFHQPNALFLKQSRSSTVVELELPIQGKMQAVIYKRFGQMKWGEPVLATVRRSAALRSWVFGHGLRVRRLPTPRPLAILHRRRFGLYGEAYLLTEKISDALNLHHFAQELAALAPAAGRIVLRRLIERLAALVRDLHHRRISHRDLKSVNILIKTAMLDPQAQVPEPIWLIDLVGIARYRRLPRRRKVQNLARLNASFHHSPILTRTDRLRFLQVYLQWGLRGHCGWKRWWHDIEQATQAKVAHNARYGRPLI
jgi:hypothetical protein